MLRIVDYRGKWAVLVHQDGQRFRRSLGLAATEANYPAAQRQAADLERALAAGVGDIVGDIVAAYLKDTKAITKTYMEWMWGVLAPHCSGLRVDQIDRNWCRDYAIKRGKAPATIRKEIGLLSAAFSWAGKTGHVIELPGAPPPRDRHLTKTEFYMLVDAAAPHPHLQVFLHLALATGARKEAILQLTWDQVHWDRGTIWLGSKPGGKARAVVPMTESLRKVLRATQQAQEAAGFTCRQVVQYAGEPLKDIKKAFATAVKRAGLKDVTPHDLRHTAAVWMAEADIPMTQIAQFLGHSSSAVTEKFYARFSPSFLRNAARALEI